MKNGSRTTRMTQRESREAADGVIYLCGCAVNNITPDPVKVRCYNTDHLYEVAKRHLITAMTGFALKDAGISDPNFERAILASMRKTLILNQEKQRVFEKLDEAGIWHMALKGTIIRDWYPKFGMRESSDCDILFDRKYEEKVRDIMLELGYTVDSYGTGHHDVYLKKPVTNMQMHVELFGVGYGKRRNDYYENVIERLEGDGFEKHFKPEDFYIYVLDHNQHDYMFAGCGLRSLLDTYVILNRFDFDWDYIREETEKLGIREFEEENRSLAMHLFTNEKLTDTDRARLEYMIRSGVYGTVRNRVSNGVRDNGGGFKGKMHYLIRRLILPMDIVEHHFPVFYKYKVLLPFLPVYRMYRGIRIKGGKFKEELMELKK